MKAQQIPRLFCVADYQNENFYCAPKHQRVQSSLAIREKTSNSFHSMIPPQKPQLKSNDEQSYRTREGFQRVKTDSNMPMPLRNGRNLSITSGITSILSNKTIQLPSKIENPQMVNAYKNEIVTYMKDRSCKSIFKMTAFQFQTEITEKMRSILLDWLVDVHHKFKLDPETLFLTISIVDRVLELHQIPKSKFQLYGVAALFIASKYEEVYSVPHVRDLVYVCDNAYPKEEILEAEGKIISILSFDLLTTSPYRLLNVYQETAKLDLKNLMLSRYLIELSLLEYSMIQYSNNVLASAAIYLVHKIRRIHPSWSQDQMVSITGLNEIDIRTCAKEMCNLLQGQDKKQFNSLRKKFSLPKYLEVSKIRIEKRPSQNLQTLQY
ncbi:unnamed protein product (macronuclear) [Paramecium tetraurelia]|uniref:Uncharacterized protein n=1 Tax=Paramecium tetraurelia TaxID=5888 RepID=A0D782_PARTE|nr:uncharacterized protein GSPATT00001941001 [Paramecium tetraurelia]CAK78899.1 unnamed protein product [Paramecium tetraurelia]|eukprot:XP_001446296.1 hypothetical protein (macronuclear) [Paramecium tetraurelia strain d4-2]